MSALTDWLLHRTDLMGISSGSDAMAQAAGISPDTAAEIFNRETLYYADRSVIRALATALKVSVRDLERLDDGYLKTIADDHIVEWTLNSQVREPTLLADDDWPPREVEKTKAPATPLIGNKADGSTRVSFDLDWSYDWGPTVAVHYQSRPYAFAIRDSTGFITFDQFPLSQLAPPQRAMLQRADFDATAEYGIVEADGGIDVKIRPEGVPPRLVEPVRIGMVDVMRAARPIERFDHDMQRIPMGQRPAEEDNEERDEANADAIAEMVRSFRGSAVHQSSTGG